MADTPIDPNNIGPYYKILGLVCLVGFFAVMILKGIASDKWAIIQYAIIGVLFLVVIRPSLADSLFKTVVDKLPFTKYTKPGAPS